MSILGAVYDLKSYHKKGGGGEGVHGCIAIAINLAIIFAGIVNFASNNYFHTFAPPLPIPLDEILATPLERKGFYCLLLTSYKHSYITDKFYFGIYLDVPSPSPPPLHYLEPSDALSSVC